MWGTFCFLQGVAGSHPEAPLFRGSGEVVRAVQCTAYSSRPHSGTGFGIWGQAHSAQSADIPRGKGHSWPIGSWQLLVYAAPAQNPLPGLLANRLCEFQPLGRWSRDLQSFALQRQHHVLRPPLPFLEMAPEPASEAFSLLSALGADHVQGPYSGQPAEAPVARKLWQVNKVGIASDHPGQVAEQGGVGGRVDVGLQRESRMTGPHSQNLSPLHCGMVRTGI